MGIAGTIASGAGKLGKEAVKGIFSGIFGGDKKRTIKKTKVNDVKPEDGEFGTFGAGIIQNNELLSQSIDIQKEQNVILDQILKTLADIKKGSNNNGNNPPGLPDIDLPDLPDKGKGKPKPKAEVKPKVEPEAEPKAVEPKAVPEGKPGVTAASEKIENKIASGKIKEAVTKRVASAMSELAGKALPFGIGAAIGGVFGAIRWWEGDKIGAAAEVAIGASAALPVAGTAISVAGQIGLMGRDIYNDLYGTEENSYPFDKDTVNDPALIAKRMPEIGDYIAKAFEENAKKYELSKKETEEQIEKLKKLDKHVSMNEASNRNNIGGVTGAGKTTASATDADKKAYMADKSKGKMTFPEWFAIKEKTRQDEYDESTRSLEADDGQSKPSDAVREMPRYASGTDYVPETGPAVVGEKGPELVMGKKGNRITDAGAHVEKLNKGDSVLPADKTKNIILDSDWQPHIDQEKHSRYMGGRSDTMSDDERDEYEGFKNSKQKSLSSKMIDDVRNPGSNIDRGSADEFDIRARLERGERVDPNKPPETMTKRELASRIVEYGMPGLISGAYKPEEFAKITREAGQFQWQTDAEDKFHAAEQKQPGIVKPLAYAEGTANAETEANKLIDAEKITTAKTIEFIAREILFSAREMTIRTEELKVNGEPTSGGAKVLGVTPSAPSAVPSPSAPAGSPTAAPEAAAAGGDKAAAGGLTEVKTKSGKSTKVGAAYASNFQGFINDLEATGYKITSIGGYADRSNVNNPSVKSFHAMGAAIDINPGSNPNKSTKTDLPPQTGAIAAAHGLGWGMNWKSVKDPMHFSAAKSEQGIFDIQRGNIAAGEVQGGAAPAGGAPAPKADATKTDMVQAPATNTSPPKQTTPQIVPTGPGISSVDRSAPTYTGGGRNIPVAAPASQQQSNGSMTSPGTTPSNPPASAVDGKSGSALPSVPPVQGESQQELANRIKSAAPHLKNQQCVTLAKAAVGSNDSVTTWRKGANATDNELPVGTPVATFMDRKGKASERYDAGGTGSPGTGTTHAATVAGYVKDKNGKITGMQVWEQYTGSGGPRLKTYPAGQGFGEKNASNYHAVEQEGKDGQRVALGKNNPYQQYLEKQREAAAEKTGPQVAKAETTMPKVSKPDAVAETQGPPAPPTSGEQVAEIQGPSAPAAVPEDSAPKQTAENLAPPETPPTKMAEVSSSPAASGGSSPKPSGSAGQSKPGNMGAPSNELIRAYLTVAA
jgi:hypothetical protein